MESWARAIAARRTGGGLLGRAPTSARGDGAPAATAARSAEPLPGGGPSKPLAFDDTVAGGTEDHVPRHHAPFRLGRFEPLYRIGSGGMASVWAAYDPQLDRRVAVKLLTPTANARDETAQARVRLLREARTMARLSHPNVVTVYEVGTVGDEVFLAMELVEGLTLDQWLEREQPGWRGIVELYAQAARGLAAAHRAGIIHRDFKPTNVLVGEDGRVQVSDFGVARAPEPATVTAATRTLTHDSARLSSSVTAVGAVVGTPRYMSPEQHAGEPVDPRSDQFSFCVALYEALYRTPPFAAPTLPEWRAAVLRGDVRAPPASSNVPRRVWNVLARGLAPRPRRRYPTMEALLAELVPRARAHTAQGFSSVSAWSRERQRC